MKTPPGKRDAAVENLLQFLGSRIDDWQKMITAPKMVASIVFLCLLLLIDVHRRGWQLSWSRRAVKGVAATFAIFHLNFLLLPLVWLGAVWIQTGYDSVGIPAIPTEMWSAFPTWSLVLISVLVHDFANYWNHRLMHLRWLWPIHAIHHSDPDVNGLTAYRIHALEALFMWISYVLLLSWLGMPPEAMGIGAVLVMLHGVYVHIDVDWGHGPFALWLASPRFHRWHHADVEEAYGKNLANIFPFFDWLFGTYRVPGACKAPLGARGIPQNDVPLLMLWPLLEWARLVRSGVAAAVRRPVRPEGSPAPAATAVLDNASRPR
jgi:sterol desaturase/sphingolipid hydroxylase (fatty acid hydroxylase superfamily)